MFWLLGGVLVLVTATVVKSATRARTCTPPPGSFVGGEGARLHYVSRGSGRPVVFLHGNDATHFDFSLSILDRAAAEYRAIAFDRPGHGYSARPPGTASVVAQMEAIRAAIGQLGIEKPVLVGHSWSGCLVLAYALIHPDEISGVVLLAGAVYASGRGIFRDPRFVTLVPVLGRLLWTSGAPLWRPFVLRAIRFAFAPAPVPPDWLAAIEPLQIWTARHVKAAAEDFVAFARDVPALSARYREIRVPVTIVAGDCDTSVPPAKHAHRLAEAIPHATVTIIPRAGHMLQFTHPEAVMDTIRRLCATAIRPASL